LHSPSENASSPAPDVASAFAPGRRAVPRAVSQPAAAPASAWGGREGVADAPVLVPDWQLLHARDRRPGRRLLMIEHAVPVESMGVGLPRTRALLDALVRDGNVVS